MLDKRGGIDTGCESGQQQGDIVVRSTHGSHGASMKVRRMGIEQGIGTLVPHGNGPKKRHGLQYRWTRPQDDPRIASHSCEVVAVARCGASIVIEHHEVPAPAGLPRAQAALSRDAVTCGK
jgi:hypothetical protein